MSTVLTRRTGRSFIAAAIALGFIFVCLLASPANAGVVNIYSDNTDGTIYHLFPPSTVTGTFPANDLIVGSTNNADYVGIAFFELPDLKGGLLALESASLRFTVVSSGKMTDANADIWGLGYVSGTPSMSTSWHLLADTDAGAGLGVTSRTKIADDIVPMNTSLAVNALVQTDVAQNATLLGFLNSLYANGADGNDYAVIRFNPDAAPSIINNNYRFGGSHRGSRTSLLTVTVTPEPGTILLVVSCIIALAPMTWRRRRRR